MSAKGWHWGRQHARGGRASVGVERAGWSPDDTALETMVDERGRVIRDRRPTSPLRSEGVKPFASAQTVRLRDAGAMRLVEPTR